MMALLTINEIQHGLDKEFLPLEPMLTGFRLVNGGMLETSLIESEKQLGVTLPLAFRDMIKTFNFGRLTIGPVVFCNAGDYLKELVELNTSINWWGEGQRPINLLMVANSDPYAILLNVNTGHILAMDVERGWQHAMHIANGFDVYLRGVGTTMLRRNELGDKALLARDVLADAGGSNLAYWAHLAK
jgi:hypothetical protein